MNSFLNQLARHLLKHYSDSMQELCVVLPNRRARVFLKSELGKSTHQPVWLPEIFGMEDFIEKISGKTILSSFSLLFELFQVHKQIGKSDRTIDEFLHWGRVILHDFNEIDLYRADAGALFENLSEIKAMEKWHPGEPLSPMEQSYLRFFASLKSYYTHLNTRLAAQSSAYQGAAFRYVAENISRISSGLSWKKVVFAGFNALSLTEKEIIFHLREQGLAEVLFDADAFYMNDPKQEAGRFLREMKAEYPDNGFSPIADHFSKPKSIHIVSASGKITMAKAAANILADLSPDYCSADTAVVLVDEELLIPFVSAIPEKAGAFNITMGFPFSVTAASDLIAVLLNLWADAESNAVTRNQKQLYYYHHLIALFQHPWAQFVPGLDLGRAHQLVDRMNTSNRIFYPVATLQSILQVSDPETIDALKLFPGTLPVNPQQALEKISRLFAVIHSRIFETKSETNKYDYEFVCQGITFINLLQRLLDSFSDIGNIRILKIITQQMGAEIKIPFIGEPLTGLQVMGMLETRTLDFKNLIMISVNEGVLPEKKNYSSLIPYDLRKAFGIPSYKEKNAVYAYHFYRLLQRAENAWLLYDTNSEGLGKGEPSRFLMQLEDELPRYNPGISITTHVVIDHQVPNSGTGPDSVIKSPAVMEKLYALAAKGLAPTALNAYRSCELRFFFSSVMGATEPDEVEELIDNRLFGIAVHKTLENLYVPYLNKELALPDVETMLKNAEETLIHAFLEKFPRSDILYGHNLMAFNAALSYVKRMLRYEKYCISRGDQIVVKALESKMITHLTLQSDKGTTFDVLLKGFLDRIDNVNGTDRVIDYKTGTIDMNNMRPMDAQKILEDKRAKKSIQFQLYMYQWLFHQQFPDTPLPEPGVWALKKSEDPIYLLSFTSIDSNPLERFELFTKWLSESLLRMFNPEIPFQATEDSDVCKNCPFRETICLR
ncbi:MAG: PD-(D/E)XK nuclease family protein [Bacteroidia bacterium]|nr:PD-(D/E)XK nuclease family protein [Bacteroidales bacterium]NCD40535.1 PD-(D/E)XK nuclease family protein [Bacteroidia bacterium]MDD2321998.1 PD-(D/E)XK nuclease family protein [Bacteroidales bacterium]MDD3010045.1 PD-(D/E)XK nuclease family protein [Bacteroidales bacterium]MDD3960836.1 PD-(D/E)XK nuclease family protein [Bacteroidales bacterium]